MMKGRFVIGIGAEINCKSSGSVSSSKKGFATVSGLRWVCWTGDGESKGDGLSRSKA